MTKNSFILILLLLTTLYPKNIRDTLHIQKREKSNAGGVLIVDSATILTTTPSGTIDSVLGFTTGDKTVRAGVAPNSDTSQISHGLIHGVTVGTHPVSATDSTFEDSYISETDGRTNINSDSVAIKGIFPDTLDTIVFFENGVLKRCSKCESTFPPEFHYHTIFTAPFVGDSISAIRDDMDNLVSESIKVGTSGSTIAEIQMFDDTNDTLFITVGGKTWKFIPDLDQ